MFLVFKCAQKSYQMFILKFVPAECSQRLYLVLPKASLVQVELLDGEVEPFLSVVSDSSIGSLVSSLLLTEFVART